MTSVTLPADREFGKTLSGLLGKEVKVKQIKPTSLLGPKNAFFAIYDDGAGVLSAAWFSDMAASASLAAALTLVPAGVVKEAVQKNKLAPELVENAREVANITANSFGGKRVRLIDFWPLAAEASPAATAWVQQAKNRIDLQVEVVGYVAGVISLLTE